MNHGWWRKGSRGNSVEKEGGKRKVKVLLPPFLCVSCLLDFFSLQTLVFLRQPYIEDGLTKKDWRRRKSLKNWGQMFFCSRCCPCIAYCFTVSLDTVFEYSWQFLAQIGGWNTKTERHRRRIFKRRSWKKKLFQWPLNLKHHLLKKWGQD